MVAFVMVRSLVRRAAARGLATLATQPNMTLTVRGVTPRLVVRTNMETYVADVDASTVDADVEARATDNGDLHVRAALHEPDGVTTIAVPASFNVVIEMDSRCDVDVDGWLEGTVEVAVPEGSVSVNTVRGLLTSITTGRGDVSVKHVEGNLHVVNGDDGSVTLGKVMGEDVRVVSSGELTTRAVFARRLDVRAMGGVRSSVLSAEEAVIEAGGDCTFDSAEGVLHLVHHGHGCTVVQASEQLRSLTLERPHAGGEEGGEGEGGARGRLGSSVATARNAEDSAADEGCMGQGGAIEIYVPNGMAVHAELLAASTSLDERLLPKQVHGSQQGDGEGRVGGDAAGGGGGGDEAIVSEGSTGAYEGGLVTPPPPLSTRGTKTFAGYAGGASTAATPWWSAQAREGWAASAEAAASADSVAYLLGGATLDGSALQLRVRASEASLTVKEQNWLEQRLKQTTRRRPQPYR